MIQPSTLNEYKVLIAELQHCKPHEKLEITRHLLRTDLFFLLWYGCGRVDIFNQWLMERCKEVQASPNGHLDLWAREHYKSTIITFAKTLQDILASHGDNPLPEWKGMEPTFGIFSFTRPIAKGFLRQIKFEFETNELLRSVFPDVIWQKPQKESPKWSEDEGIILKRKTNPKEATIEAWGIVDSQPTSKHFTVCVYDDVITKDNVTTPEMIQKTTEAWEMSINLGSEGGYRRYIGTRYHANDTYSTMMKRGVANPRIYTATDDNTPNGNPVLISREYLEEKRKAMGPYTFATQMLQNPLADETQGFKRDWLRFYKDHNQGAGLNIYMVVDPANGKKKDNDYTVIWIIGLGADKNYYTLDGIRDRLNLKQRGEALFRLHRKWRPISVGYEQYGMQADIQYIEEEMERKNYRFLITPLGGKVAKVDRIRALIPIFSDFRWLLPDTLFKANYEGKTIDLIDSFINEEYEAFPVSVHDDMLDCKARILDPDLNAIWPIMEDDDERDRYSRSRRKPNASAWAA
jgi:phage terminase large subunit-like protein